MSIESKTRNVGAEKQIIPVKGEAMVADAAHGSFAHGRMNNNPTEILKDTY